MNHGRLWDWSCRCLWTLVILRSLFFDLCSCYLLLFTSHSPLSRLIQFLKYRVFAEELGDDLFHLLDHLNILVVLVDFQKFIYFLRGHLVTVLPYLRDADLMMMGGQGRFGRGQKFFIELFPGP